MTLRRLSLPHSYPPGRRVGATEFCLLQDRVRSSALPISIDFEKNLFGPAGSPTPLCPPNSSKLGRCVPYLSVPYFPMDQPTSYIGREGAPTILWLFQMRIQK